MVFGLLQLLGVSYRPELADLPDQKLWRIDANADYGLLDRAARGKIDLALVERHWADILRIVASVHDGAVSAYDVMRMLQHGGNPTQLGMALAHFGRIFKLCMCCPTSMPNRIGVTSSGCVTCKRRATAWVNTCSMGAGASCAGRITRGMEDQLGALGLVINCITLWNTVYIDRILTTLRDSGYDVRDADVARLHPYPYAHINVHGHYAFRPSNLAAGIGRRPLRDIDAADDD
jgi:TnpA family transposase